MEYCDYACNDLGTAHNAVPGYSSLLLWTSSKKPVSWDKSTLWDFQAKWPSWMAKLPDDGTLNSVWMPACDIEIQCIWCGWARQLIMGRVGAILHAVPHMQDQMEAVTNGLATSMGEGEDSSRQLLPSCIQQKAHCFKDGIFGISGCIQQQAAIIFMFNASELGQLWESGLHFMAAMLSTLDGHMKTWLDLACTIRDKLYLPAQLKFWMEA